jgi:hypothetical protein
MKAEGGHIGATMSNPVIAELRVTVKSNGELQITGPLQDKQLCLDILEEAKKQIAGASTEQLISSN